MVYNQFSEGSFGVGPPPVSYSSTSKNVANGKKEACLKTDVSLVLNMKTLNPYILGFKVMEWAILGPVNVRAAELEKEVDAANRNGRQHKFNEIIKMSLGDAHAMGQKPLTFVRQVLALVSCPELIETCQFNDDVKRKAREILCSCRGGSAGSYSDSRGIQIIRKHVAKHLEIRDGGIPAKFEDIILCQGASEGIRACLKLLKSAEEETPSSTKAGASMKKAGVIIPVPEYPIYSATLEEYNMSKVCYYLDERESGWEVNVSELDRIVEKARETCEPRAIVIINPGNPTGHLLSRENMENIIRFAFKEHLIILADEVYQDNVYGLKKFFSFKKVLAEMEAPFNSVELISVHSCSKGFIAECGLRAGYFEVVNMDPEVKSVLSASVVANLCPTVLGQTVVDCLVDPPKEGDPSYEMYVEEKSTILGNLGERAELVHEAFNSIPGISCARLDGSMYAFPQVYLPDKAIAAAKQRNLEPDVFYCLNLLENTGICVVPGSGMGQLPGTYHFRSTLLAPTDKMKKMLENFKEFHLAFLKKYS